MSLARERARREKRGLPVHACRCGSWRWRTRIAGWHYECRGCGRTRRRAPAPPERKS